MVTALMSRECDSKRRKFKGSFASYDFLAQTVQTVRRPINFYQFSTKPGDRHGVRAVWGFLPRFFQATADEKVDCLASLDHLFSLAVTFSRFAPRDIEKWILKEHLQNGSNVDAFFENEPQTTMSETFTEITHTATTTEAMLEEEEEELVLETSDSSTTFTSSASMALSSPLYLLYSIPWIPPLTFAPQWSLSSFYLPWVG